MAAQDPTTGRCGARASSTGRPCGRPAGWGTDHVGVGRCKLHGGAAPKAQVAGVIELARREAAVMGRPLDIDPHDAILQCIRITAGEVQYASARVAELEPDEAVGPVVTTRPLKHEKGAESMYERVEEHGAPALHVWVQVRQQAMDRLVNYSKVAIAAGVAERQVRLAERLGGALAVTIGAILDDLGLRDDPRAPEVVARHLALLEQGDTIEGSEAA